MNVVWLKWVGWGVAVLGWVAIGGVVIIGIGEVQKAKVGIVKFADGYAVKWQPVTGSFKLIKDGEVIEKFVLQKRPLALWYRPSTGSMVIVAAEDGRVEDKHLLYLWKDGLLRSLYYSVDGVNTTNDSWVNGWLYLPINNRETIANDVYLTPKEERLIARSTSGYGFTPLNFDVAENRLISGRDDYWNNNEVSWSPNGRCLVNISDSNPDAWGYFFRPYDFLYKISQFADGAKDIEVRWKSEIPCEAYIKLNGSELRGEGSESIVDQDFYYHLSEDRGIESIAKMPIDFERYDRNLSDDWQMVMATYIE